MFLNQLRKNEKKSYANKQITCFYEIAALCSERVFYVFFTNRNLRFQFWT